MKTYRIITNGLTWKVQYLGRSFWKGKPKWKQAKEYISDEISGHTYSYDAEYYTLAQAERFIEEQQKAERLQDIAARGFTVCTSQ